MSRFTPESIGKLLLFGGWAVLLSYFPSGWLHQQMGGYVYLRDILLGLHLFGCLVYLSKNGQLSTLLAKVWPLFLVPLFLFPALFIAEIRVEMGGYIKWSVIWLDCIVLGRLISQFFTWNTTARVLAIITAITMLADLGTGYYELKNDVFAIPMKGQLSPMGVEMGKDINLKEFKRIKGLQRDVFSFANLMGLGVLAGLCVIISVENIAQRVIAGLWIIVFSTMLFKSGGRSAFFGVGAAGLVGIGLVLRPEIIRRNFSKIALGWLAIGLFMSFFGIGEFTEWFSSKMMKGSHIGDSRSAYMRDDNWKGVRDAIGNVPIVLFTGSPLGSMIDTKVAPVFHWADNNYLWLLYHGSFISLAGLILYFRNVLARAIPESRLWTKDCMLLFLLFVMGEAIARESLSFLGCMPLFIACGCVEGIRLATSGSSRSRGKMETITSGQLASRAVTRHLESTRKSSRSPRKKTDADSLAERIARRSSANNPSEE